MKSKLITGLMVTLFLVSMLSMVCLVSAPIPREEGDVVDDDIVDIFDGVAIGLAFGSNSTDLNWNPDADLAEEWGLIDIMDILVWASHFGEADP